MSTEVSFAAALAAAYLIGSIPFSYIVGRIATGTDMRTEGSGNVGATNVLRNAGKKAGVIALLLDIAKGWTAVSVAGLLHAGTASTGSNTAPLSSLSLWLGAAGLVAVLGHMYPVWLNFQGGKGVATATGVFLALAPLAVLVAAVVLIITVALTKYVSLGSIVAAAVIPILLRFVMPTPFWTIVFATVISTIVILKHHTNIARLVAGDERKFPR